MNINNKREELVKKQLIADGWNVLQTGWPDFIAFKDGKTRFIEVKSKADFVHENQEAMHELLYKAFGIKTEIRIVETYEIEKFVLSRNKTRIDWAHPKLQKLLRKCFPETEKC